MEQDLKTLCENLFIDGMCIAQLDVWYLTAN